MLGMNFIINVMIKLLINLNYTIIYIYHFDYLLNLNNYVDRLLIPNILFSF